MHACGHDFHAAAVLGADWLLKKQEAELPGKVMLITVTQFHGGNTWNVIPGKVQLEGTVRTKTPEARELKARGDKLIAERERGKEAHKKDGGARAESAGNPATTSTAGQNAENVADSYARIH